MISKEDKADVKRKMGKAMANKVARATRDKFGQTKGERIGKAKAFVDKYGGNAKTSALKKKGDKKRTYSPGTAGSRLTKEQIAERVKNWNKTAGKNHDIMGS